MHTGGQHMSNVEIGCIVGGGQRHFHAGLAHSAVTVAGSCAFCDNGDTCLSQLLSHVRVHGSWCPVTHCVAAVGLICVAFESWTLNGAA